MEKNWDIFIRQGERANRQGKRLKRWKGGELMQSVFEPGSDMMGTEFGVGRSGCTGYNAERKDER